MILNIILLVVGFILLIRGADFFVDGASSVASNFRVPKILIGLTIVAFGTSAPELAVSFKALASGVSDMVLGNVIGSNILNILLILGLAATIKPIHIRKNTIRKELPICLLISTLLAILFLDTQLASGALNQISRADGITILLFFGVFLYYLFATALTGRKNKNENEKPKFTLGKSFAVTIIGLLGIVFGSNFVVDGASGLAAAAGVSERIISLTIIALGTSLPELITTVVSAKKGETDLAIGNIIGSNIFNICMVLGIPVALFGAVTPASFHMIDIIMLVVSAAIMSIFATTRHKITRIEGIIMLVLFAAYYSYICLATV